MAYFKAMKKMGVLINFKFQKFGKSKTVSLIRAKEMKVKTSSKYKNGS